MQSTFIACIRSQNVQKDETFCYNKKKTHTKLIAIIEWLASNKIENIKYNFQCIYTVIKIACE